MYKLLSTTALLLTLSVSGMAYADNEQHHKMHGGQFMEEAIAKLPEQDAAKFRDTMKQAHEKNKATFEQSRALRQELQTILTAEKFDKQAYLAKNAKLQKLHAKMHENFTEAFATAASQLSQEERKTLAAGMHHPHGDNAPSESPAN